MSTEQKPIPNIVFEYGDFENDIEMLSIEKTENSISIYIILLQMIQWL
jgi:hypothetical protein